MAEQIASRLHKPHRVAAYHATHTQEGARKRSQCMEQGCMSVSLFFFWASSTLPDEDRPPHRAWYLRVQCPTPDEETQATCNSLPLAVQAAWCRRTGLRWRCAEEGCFVWPCWCPLTANPVDDSTHTRTQLRFPFCPSCVAVMLSIVLGLVLRCRQ